MALVKGNVMKYLLLALFLCHLSLIACSKKSGSEQPSQPIPPETPAPDSSKSFVFVWKASSLNQIFTLPLREGYEYNFTIHWGDESSSEITSYDDSDRIHTYDGVGEYTVTLSGLVESWFFPEDSPEGSEGCQIIFVSRLGDVGWKNLQNAFYGCVALTEVRGGNVSEVTDMSGLFKNAISVSPDMGAWDFGNVTSMAEMFSGVILPTEIYSSLLTRISETSQQTGVSLDGGGSKYDSVGGAARQILEERGWMISDGGMAAPDINDVDQTAPRLHIGNQRIDSGGSFFYTIDESQDIQDLSHGESYTISLDDAGGSGVTYDSGAKTLSVTSPSVGSYTISGTISDGTNASLWSFVLVVQDVTTPILTIAAQTINEGQNFSYTIDESQDIQNVSNGESYTISLDDAGGSGVTYDSGTLSATSPSVGSYTISGTISDGTNSSSWSFVLVVQDVTTPTLTIAVQTVNEGVDFSYTIDESQDIQNLSSGESYTIRLVDAGGSGVTYDSGTLSATSPSVGSYTINGTISDGTNTSLWSFVLVVQDVTAPTLTIAAQTMNEGQNFSYTIDESQDIQNVSNGESYTIRLDDAGGSGVTYASGTKTLSATSPSVGSYTISGTISDGTNASLWSFVLVVQDVTTPILTIAAQTINEGADFSYTINESQDIQNLSNGESYTIRLDDAGGSGVTYASGTKTLSATSPSVGSYTISGTISDGTNASLWSFVLVVQDVTTPILTIAAQTINEGADFSYTINESQDIQNLSNGESYTIRLDDAGGSGVTYDSGTLSATSPPAGSYTISGTISDGTNQSSWSFTLSVASSGSPFIFVWRATDANKSITLPLPYSPGGFSLQAHNYNFTVRWGDGSSDQITSFRDSDRIHTYASAGDYTVTISGLLEAWHYPLPGGIYPTIDCHIISVTDLGDVGWKNLSNAFYGCSQLQSVSGGNVSDVTDMSYMFTVASLATPDVSGWDVSSVENMSHMFYSANAANPDVSGWVVSSVEDMSYMFYSANVATPDVSGWDVSHVQNMSGMFAYLQATNVDVSGWDVSSVTNMYQMFRQSRARPDVSGWDVSSVANMGEMFAYHANLGQWHPDMSTWNFSSVTDMESFFVSKLPTSFYSSLLVRIAATAQQNNVPFSVTNSSKYNSSAVTARGTLVGRGWRITDGGLSGGGVPPPDRDPSSDDETAPTLTIANHTINEGQSFSYRINESQNIQDLSSGESYTITVTNAGGSGVTYVSGTKTFSATSPSVGSYTISGTISDGTNQSSWSFTLLVQDVTAPTLTIANQTINGGQNFSYRINKSRDIQNLSSGESYTITVTNSGGSGVTYTSGTKTFSATSPSVGSYTISGTISDGTNQSSWSFTLLVQDVTAPTLTIANQTIDDGQNFSYRINKSRDIQNLSSGESYTITVTNVGGSGVTYTSGTKTFSATSPSVGSYTIRGTISDGTNQSSWSFTLLVQDVTAPTLTIANQTIDEGQNFSYRINKSRDIQNLSSGESYTITVTNVGGSGVTYTSGTKTFSATSPSVGSYTIRGTISDGTNQNSWVFTLVVRDVTAPTLTIAEQTIDEGQDFSYRINKSRDIQNLSSGESYTITVTNVGGSGVTYTSGTFSATSPSAGSYTVTGTISDGTNQSDWEFVLTVNPPLDLKVINVTKTTNTWNWECNQEEGCTYRHVFSEIPPQLFQANTFTGTFSSSGSATTPSSVDEGQPYHLYIQVKKDSVIHPNVFAVARHNVEIIAGSDHNCVVLESGRVKCWGKNSDGQLGQGHTNNLGDDVNESEMGNDLPFVDLGTDTGDNTGTPLIATKVGSGPTHTCALLVDGRVKCWGKNSDGQLGQGHTINLGDGVNEMGNDLPFVDLGTDTGDNTGTPLMATKVEGGQYHTCALLVDGRVKCWGKNSDGQLGQGHMRNLGDDGNEMGNNLPFVDLGTNFKAVDLSLGSVHNCALLNNQRVKCWGANPHLQLGGYYSGSGTSLASTGDQGDNSNEMGDNLSFVNLGNGDSGNPLKVQSIVAGLVHTCAVIVDGRVMCWGDNQSGLLGQGSVAGTALGVLPGTFTNLGTNVLSQAIVTGGERWFYEGNEYRGFHTCALLTNGRVKCWGYNLTGQLGQNHANNLGDGANEMGDNLDAIDFGTDTGDDSGTLLVVRSIVAGDYYTCAILENNRVKCFGAGEYGVLGGHREPGAGLASFGSGRRNSDEMGNNLPYVDLGTVSFVAREFEELPPLRVSFARTSYAVTEGEPSAISVGVSLSRAPGVPLTFPLSVTYRENGKPTDWQTPFPTQVVFNSSETSKTFQIPQAVDNSILNTSPRITDLSLGPFPPGGITAGSITTSILINEDGDALLPGVSITASSSSPINEGETATFNLSRTGSTSAALTVNVEITTDDEHRGSLGQLPRTVSFEAGSDSVDLPIPTENYVAGGDFPLTATLLPSDDESYLVSEQASATITVTDDGTDGTFIGTWRTKGSNQEIQLPLVEDYQYNFTVDWGDGTSDTVTSHNDSDRKHIYANAGTYEVRITGLMEAWSFDGARRQNRILSVSNLGDMGWKNLKEAFDGCEHLTEVSGGNVSNVTTMDAMFQDAAQLATTNISHWNISQVTDMRQMFNGARRANPDMSQWDFGKVGNMKRMFSGVTLPTSTYSTMLQRIRATTQYNSIPLDGGNSKYDAFGLIARQALEKRSWTITDGGPIDGAPIPTITSVDVTSSPEQGDTYLLGEFIEITLTFSEAVVHTGNKTVSLILSTEEVGARYKSGSGTTKLVFSYETKKGDSDSDGITISEAGLSGSGTIIAVSGSWPANLSYSEQSTLSAHKVDGSEVTVKVAAGGQHTCAILDNRRVKCWGYNNDGQLGQGHTNKLGDGANEMGANLPYVDLGTDTGDDSGSPLLAKEIGAGSVYSCALLMNGRVKCWGGGRNSVFSRLTGLGLGHRNDVGDEANEMGHNLPYVDLGTDTGDDSGSSLIATKIVVGLLHACAIFSGGDLKCWGNNRNGQLGQGHKKALGDGANEMGNNLPVIALGTNLTAVEISLGSQHTCALLSNQRVKCWGSNLNLQLGGYYSGSGTSLTSTGDRGDGANEMGDNLAFVDLGNDSSSNPLKVKAISTKGSHTCAVIVDGRVTCWGWNGYGELGQGSWIDREVGASSVEGVAPGTVTDLGTNILANMIVVGGDLNGAGSNNSGFAYTCALLTNGRVKCWGTNVSGQLGQGHTNQLGDGANEMGDNLDTINLGTDTGDASGTSLVVRSITSGSYHNCVVFTNNRVKCWGNGFSGQLGYNNKTSRGDGANEMGNNLPYVDLGDIQAPILSNAVTSTDGTKVILTFTEELAFTSGQSPSLSSFLIHVNSIERRISSFMSTSNDMGLQFSLSSPVKAQQTVTITYTDPTTADDDAALQGLFGNDVSTFTQSVTNESVVTTVPSQPRSFKSKRIGDNKVKLTWKAPLDGGGLDITGYRYKKKTGASYGSWTSISNSAPGQSNDKSYTISNLTAGTTYDFVLQAVNSDGGSADSNKTTSTVTSANPLRSYSVDIYSRQSFSTRESLDTNNISESGTISVPMTITFDNVWLSDRFFNRAAVYGDIVILVETLGKGEHPQATATEGEDFQAVSQEITISSPQRDSEAIDTTTTRFNFDLNIIADEQDEPDEKIIIKASIIDGTNFEFHRANSVVEGLELRTFIDTSNPLVIKDDD